MSGGMLGWRPPEDRSHERRYALAAAMPSVACPVVMGVNWYTAVDKPISMDLLTLNFLKILHYHYFRLFLMNR